MYSKLKGHLVNESTGETFDVERFFYPSNLRMSSIVKVQKIKSFHHPNNKFQVSVHCEALDFAGNVFGLGIEFFPDLASEKDRLVEDIKSGEIYLIEGRYGVAEDGFTLYEPAFKSILEMPELCEEEIRQVFQANSMKGG